jgi:hypothetical protein
MNYNHSTPHCALIPRRLYAQTPLSNLPYTLS